MASTRRSRHQGGIRDVLADNARANLDPGGFTLLLRAWMAIGGPGGIWQRLLPFLFFTVGMGALAALAWTWRRSIPFAILSGLVPVCFPLLLNYSTEVRAYSMEFAGVTLGSWLLARFIAKPSLSSAAIAGTALGIFLTSRYSYGLFAASASVAVLYHAFRWEPAPTSRRFGPATAFLAPLVGIGTLEFLRHGSSPIQGTNFVPGRRPPRLLGPLDRSRQILERDRRDPGRQPPRSRGIAIDAHGPRRVGFAPVARQPRAPRGRAIPTCHLRLRCAEPRRDRSHRTPLAMASMGESVTSGASTFTRSRRSRLSASPLIFSRWRRRRGPPVGSRTDAFHSP